MQVFCAKMNSDEEINIVGWDDMSDYISYILSPENQGSTITRTPSIHSSSENVKNQCSDMREFLSDQKIKTETLDELNIFYDLSEKVELTINENDLKSYSNIQSKNHEKTTLCNNLLSPEKIKTELQTDLDYKKNFLNIESNENDKNITENGKIIKHKKVEVHKRRLNCPILYH